jgi:transcriptional regulator with XRE-family HTH domain
MDSTTIQTLAPQLKKLRAGSLLTQKQLAEALGINPRTLIRWEAGQGEPALSDLLTLSKFFGVSISELVDDPMRPGRAGPLPKVADLSGGDLDYWIAKVKGLPVALVDGAPVVYEAGFGHRPTPKFSSDLSLAEPLMHSKGVHLCSLSAGSEFDGDKKDVDGWVARCRGATLACWGTTVAEAGMRAWLSEEIGAQILA